MNQRFPVMQEPGTWPDSAGLPDRSPTWLVYRAQGVALNLVAVTRKEGREIREVPGLADQFLEIRHNAYGGRGQITDIQQPRYGQQIFDILFPF